MADESIDIEEHDILDNPLVRRMFPDIAVLKKEVLDFDDEVLNEEIPANGIVNDVLVPCFPSKLAEQATSAKFTERICTQINETVKYPPTVIDETNVTSFHSSNLGDEIINVALAENDSTQKNETGKSSTVVIDEANTTLSNHSNAPTNPVINAIFAENKLKQINEFEKYPVIVVDEANITLSHHTSKLAYQVVDTKLAEVNCKQKYETEKYPIIVIDEINTTLSHHSSKPTDYVFHTKLSENNSKRISENKKSPTKVTEKTKVSLPYFSSEPAKQVLDAHYTHSDFTKIKKAEKYPTIEIDETEVNLPCHLNKPADKLIHEKSSKSSFREIIEAKKYQTKVIEGSSKNVQRFPTDLSVKDIHVKYSNRNVSQINVVKKYPTRVINETSENLQCILNQSEEQGYKFGSQSSQTNKRHLKCYSRFNKRMKTDKDDDTQKTCPSIVKEKQVDKNGSSDSFLQNCNSGTCNINEQQSNEVNATLNLLKVPQSTQKTSVLLKQGSEHSHLNSNLPQQGENISLTDISSAKSTTHCPNNTQLEQCKWKGNKIILGSKSSTIKSQNKASEKQNISRNLIVSVENLGTFLSKSTRYCKYCFILFPSNKTLGDHRDLTHCHLHNDPPSKAKKMIRGQCKCNVCGREFFSSSNLMKHKRWVHSQPLKKRKIKANLNQNIHPQLDGKLNEGSKFRCTHCNKSFSSRQILIDHMYNVLQNKPNKDEIKTSIENKNLNREKTHSNSSVFYRCPFCSYYFIQKICYIRHLGKKHKTVDNIDLEKVVFDPFCEYCYGRYSKFQYFNVHIWKNHQNKLNYVPKNISEKGGKKSKNKEQIQSTINNNKNDTNKDKGGMVVEIKSGKLCEKYLLKSVIFKCLKCHICFLSGAEAANHIGHKHIRTRKCSKCSQIFKNEEQNQHAYQHLFCGNFDVVEIGENTYKYLLFKCPNCASYFREIDFFYHYSICEKQSPDSAYCKTCHILIDNNIKELHEIHHKMEGGRKLKNILIETDVITYEGTANSVKESFEVSNAESEVKQSNYISHEGTDDKIQNTLKITYNGNNGNNLTNSVINSHFHVDYKEKPERDIVKKDFPRKIMTTANTEKPVRFMYCGTCKAFIFVSTVRKLYGHIKGRCLNLTNYVCKYCGLVLSNKTIDSHRKLHQDVPNLTLSDFTFYDLRNGKEIYPPVPKYPNCHLCEKHFITKTAIISHVCSEDYLKCTLCNIKLSKDAFSLHMSFHNYSSKTKSVISLVDLSVHSKESHPTSETKLHLHLLESNANLDDEYLLVYICKICKVAVDTYDRVIEHCQYHIGSQEKEILTKPCDSCNLIFEDSCFDNHKILHTCNQNEKFSSLTYDAFYVTAEDKVWLNHLFGSLPKNEIGNILKYSIYNVERKIKMQILQDGSPDLTFYKCAKCNNFIDPSSLYDHCRMDVLCYKSKSATCPVCGLLMSDDFLNKHEKIHETQNVTMSSYRFVLINCDDDKTINHILSLPRHYIVYECRNCNGIVDKKQFQCHKCNFEDLSKCSHCGLLLYKNDYMPHVVKHKEFCSFHENNIIVISIGVAKEGEKLPCRHKSSFRGMKLDYLFYKCNRCLICHTEKQRSLTHDCAEDLAKTRCVPCDLYFEDSSFKKHRKLHECDPYFSKENVTVIELDLRYSRPRDIDVIVIEDEKDLNNVNDNTIGDNKLNSTNNIERFDENVVEKYDEIFRCDCGLHFMNEASALSHITKCNNARSSKQTCPKCGLLFKPNILYSHLLKHHGNKHVSYTFNITPISKTK